MRPPRYGTSSAPRLRQPPEWQEGVEEAGGQEDLEGREDVERYVRRKLYAYAYTLLLSPFGTLKFVRMEGLFGSHSSPLALTFSFFSVSFSAS